MAPSVLTSTPGSNATSYGVDSSDIGMYGAAQRYLVQPGGGLGQDGRATGLRVPRVPSLVFDLELDDASAKAGTFSEEDCTAGLKELRRWLMPQCTGELQLRADVEQALRAASKQQQLQQQLHPENCPPKGADEPALEANQRLATHLGRRGYLVSIRTALGGGDGTDCLRNLRHVFLTVLPPGAHATTARFVVDLSFKEQFRIAKPTPRYSALLACLPDVYVAPEAAVAPLVNFLCLEMATAFKATGTVLPPWRAASSMLSKWLPRKSLDEQVIARLPAPAPLVPSQHTPGQTQHPNAAHPPLQHRKSVGGAMPVHGHWSRLAGNGVVQGPAAHQLLAQPTAGQKVPAAPARPIACEPQRVVRGW